MTNLPVIRTESPATRDEVRELLRRASAERLKVAPIGHGTKLAMGGAGAPVDMVLSLERMNRICDYPSSDLTISVEPGLPIRELSAVLLEKKQLLPLDVPFALAATVGGALSANSSGALRLAYGTWRDFVLGMQFVTADGKLAKGGGKVVKNVAGYDIPKLLIGSQGTLAVITEVTLKVFPLPPASTTIALTFHTAEQSTQAAQTIVGSQMLPCALDMVDSVTAAISDLPELCDSPFTLLAGAAGPEVLLARFERDLPALVRTSGLQSFVVYRRPEERKLWRTLREFTPLFLRQHPDGVVVKASLPFTQMGEFIERARATAEKHGLHTATLARAGSGIIYTHLWDSQTSTGSLSGEPAPALAAAREPAGNTDGAPLITVAELLIRGAEQRGGRAIVEWCPAELKSRMNLWGTLGDDLAWMRKVKAALDPQGILNPGRFYGGI